MRPIYCFHLVRLRRTFKNKPARSSQNEHDRVESRMEWTSTFVDPTSEKFAMTPELEFFFTDRFLLFRFS